MTREIFLIQEDGRLHSMREQAYDSEALLQTLLAQYPHLLVGEQIDPKNPRRWLLINREISVPVEGDGAGWMPVDHLFIDQDAVPTLVEVKRSTDTRIRREVVGQMLDYAANAVAYLPVETLISRFEARCTQAGIEPDEELANFLGVDKDPAAFWVQVKTNLQAGKVRLLFVADEIPSELRRIVEFLNQQMDPAEVLAIEIKQYTGTGLRTLVPTVIGQSAEAQQRKSSPSRLSRQWDEGSFFAALGEGGSAEDVAVARQILNWARSHATRIWWGRGQRDGSFVPVLDHGETDYPLFAVFSYGALEIYFQHYLNRPAFADEPSRIELLGRLNAISGLNIPADGITRRPSVPLKVLTQEGALDSFLAVFQWFIEQVRTSDS